MQHQGGCVSRRYRLVAQIPGAPRCSAGAFAILIMLLGVPEAVRAAEAPPIPSITVYSDRHQAEDTQIYDAFTKETGVKVDIVDGTFDELLEKLKAAGAKSDGDLLVSSGCATLWRTAEAGLFQKLPMEAVDPSIPRDFRDPAGRWIGLAYWARVIVEHKDRVDAAEIATYEDLADPKLHGRVIVRSASSPYNIALVASLIDANGTEAAEEWARGIVANFARPPQGGDSNQLKALAAGEADVAIVNTRFWARFAASDKVTEREIVDNLAVIFPNQTNRGTQIDLVGAGLLKSAPHPKSAQTLIDFLLRPDIQAKFASADFEYPVRPDVPAPAVLAALGPFKMDLTALSKLGRFTPEAEKVMARAGWE
ncbi:MAG: iron(III) transport system substrate-binding protein [Aliidongia sp.]|nr:iron(III) transport system substrate-binding protein [Aliidongia sp.]